MNCHKFWDFGEHSCGNLRKKLHVLFHRGSEELKQCCRQLCMPTTACFMAAFILKSQTAQVYVPGHHFPSAHSTFPVPVSLPLFSPSTAHIVFFTPYSLLSKPVWPLCCRLELQVSVCVPARYATGLAREQAQELLPRTGASYRVQLICSNLLLWEVAAPGSTLLLYFSACTFLETSFHSLHGSTKIQIAQRETFSQFVYDWSQVTFSAPQFAWPCLIARADFQESPWSLKGLVFGVQIKLRWCPQGIPANKTWRNYIRHL